jgi:hypothetical protein
MIKIQMNKYDPIAFILAEVYLMMQHDQWYGVPRHRVKPYLPPSFLEDLDDGKLDFNEYEIRSLKLFDWQDFFIIERYYEKHYLMHKNYDKHVNIDRIYRELGSNGSSLKKKRSHKGGSRWRARK